MSQTRPFYGWTLLAALAAIASINQGGTYLGAAVINAPMAKDLGLSRGTLGLGSTVFVMCIALTAPLVARMVNSFGARTKLCTGSLLVALGSILLATCTSRGWHFVVGYGFLLGAGCSFGSMVAAQSCATLWFERRRAMALALVLAGAGLGGSISAPLLTSVIAAAHGNWRAGWFCLSAAALMVAFVSILFVKNRPEELGQVADGHAKPAGGVSRDRWTVRDAVRTPAFWLLTLASIGESVPGTATIAHAVPHLRDLGHTAAAAGSAVGIFSVCSIMGSLAVGFLCDRMDPRIAWAVLILMIGFGVLIATRAGSDVAMYLFTGLIGFGSGAALACWHATVASYFGAASFPSILSAQMPVSTTLAAASPFLVGMVYDVRGSYIPAFLALGAFSVLTAILLFFARPPVRRSLVALMIAASAQSATVPQEILQRPVPLRDGIGKAHEDVTTITPDAQAFYDQGLAYLHSYVWIEAARSFHQALRLDPKLAMAQLGLSYALAELGDSASARQASQRAAALAGAVSDRERARIRLRALQFSDQSNYLREFDLILAKYPHDTEVLMLRGQANQQTHDMPGMGAREGSLAFYERALAEQPHYFAVHHYLTHAYENAGRTDLALKHAEAYVSLAPSVPHAHHMHGHILRRMNRMQEAIGEFRTADELALAYLRTENIPPEYDWQYHHNLDLLGVSYQYAGQTRLAERLLRRSFELASMEFSQELNESAWPMLLLLEERTDQAQSAASALMGRADPVVQALGHLMASQIAMRLAHADEAVEEGDRALHLMRGSPNGGVLLPELELVQGELLLRKGQSQKGRAMLLDGVSKLRADPSSDRWTQTLLRIETVETLARDVGDQSLASDVAKQMQQFAPGYAGTHYALAKEAEHAGNDEVARREYQGAISGWSEADADFGPLTDARHQLAALGMQKVNVAPRPSLDSAQRRPLCRSMIERLIDSPTPIPLALVV